MIIRRVLGAAVASAALVLAPVAATAYTGPEEDVEVTDPTPAPGQPFGVSVDAGPDSAEATLTVTSDDPAVDDEDIEIAGTQSMTKATVNGVADFTVTLHVESNYSLIGYDEDGNVVAETVVTVGDGEAGRAGTGGDVEAGAGTDAGADAGAGLPDTGSSTTSMLLGGTGALLVLGGAAMVVGRRRRAQLN